MASTAQKLMAMDAEDLQVLSAYCQDAVMKVGDIKYFPSERRLVMEMNRFKWEDGEKQDIRTRSILHFENVQGVQTKGIDLKKSETVLSLLAIVYEAENAPSGKVDLVFSAGATLRLNVECIEAQLTDMNAAWKATSKPSHPDA